MPKGILGIEAVPPFVSTIPDVIPATSEKQFTNPRQDAIAIVPQWDSPLIVGGVFQRVPIRVNSQITMGQYAQDGSFAVGPGSKRIWDDGDICRPEMLTKYPQLEASLLYLLGVIHQEEQEAGVI